MFLDETTIEVESGKGGNGCVSFIRKKNMPRGGPDGGDGADGGSVVFKSSRDVIDYWEISRRRKYSAQKGQPGDANFKSGPNGVDTIIYIPAGTIMYDADTKEIIFDFIEPNMEFIICKGGRGGKGNSYFKSSINQIPREFELGVEGEHRTVFLELRVIADVGLVGLPNAGKSTFLSSISAARPKIANFPFTTLNPNLGVVNIKGYTRIVVADLPGLIEGSSEGKGLGIRFLKHIQRTRLLLHLVDINPDNGESPVSNYINIRKEVVNYDKKLQAKDEIILLTKCDDDDETSYEQQKLEFEQETGQKVIMISSLLEIGLNGVLEEIAAKLRKLDIEN